MRKGGEGHGEFGPREQIREDTGNVPKHGVSDGKSVRTAVFEGGCVFLQHDGRGCAVHRASLENGWDFHGTKPHICRLFPVTYDDDSIVIAEDYIDYSCAFDDSAPSLYRVQRSSLEAIFGQELIAELDAAEAAVLAAQPKKLPVVTAS